MRSNRPFRSRYQLTAAAVAFVILSPSLSAIAETDDTDKDERTCIHVASINGFNPIDKRHLTVSVGANKTYLVSLTNSCRDLRWNESIAIKATGSWTCSNSHDKIIVGEQRCFISNIQRVESHAEAKEMVLGKDRD